MQSGKHPSRPWAFTERIWMCTELMFANSRMDESDTVPKRGDEAFALGNICWRVYDQVSGAFRHP